MKRMSLTMGLVGPVVLLATWAVARAEPAADAAVAERLAPFLDAIRQADAPQVAMAAYARGGVVDRNSPALQEAYLRRMLQFGLPQIALFPARSLAWNNPKHGLAWGVIGYDQAKRGELADALASCLRAAQNAPENAAILRNAGQLLAWYDGTLDRPRLPDPLRRELAVLRQDLAAGKSKPLAEGYETAKAALEQQAKQQGQLDARAGALEGVVFNLQQQALDIDSRLREMSDQIESHQQLIDALNYDLRNVYGYPYGIRIFDHPRMYRYYYSPYYSYYPYSSLVAAAGVLDRIRQEERGIEDLRRQIALLRHQGEGVLKELDRKGAELDALHGLQSRSAASLPDAFLWDPPAVDGVVTAEIERPAPVALKPEQVPSDPAAMAEQRLALARLYLDHSMDDRAVAVLRDLLTEYPATKSAEQAKVLLAELRPKP